MYKNNLLQVIAGTNAHVFDLDPITEATSHYKEVDFIDNFQ